MVTGLDLSKLFDDKIDNSYSDYVSAQKKQRAFDNAFLRIIENKYRGMDTQKEFDELSELVVIDKQVFLNNNRFRTTPVPISSVTTGATTVFSFAAEHNMAEGEIFTVSGVAGTLTGVNQQHTVPVGGINSSTVVTISTASTGTSTASTGKAITARSSTRSNMVSDYMHVLAIKCFMYDPLKAHEIYKVYPGTPGVIEYFRPNELRTGDYMHGTVFNPTPGQDGFVLVKRISEFKYELYDATDTTLSTPVTVTSSFPGQTIKTESVQVNWAKYIQSDRRISMAGEPTIDKPRFNQHRNFILIQPSDKRCPAITIDYIKKPDVVISVTDSTVDLELFYSKTLLYKLTDEAVKMFYQEVRDPNSYMIADKEVIDNP